LKNLPRPKLLEWAIVEFAASPEKVNEAVSKVCDAMQCDVVSAKIVLKQTIFFVKGCIYFATNKNNNLQRINQHITYAMSHAPKDAPLAIVEKEVMEYIKMKVYKRELTESDTAYIKELIKHNGEKNTM
jgi:hypothetical protein